MSKICERLKQNKTKIKRDDPRIVSFAGEFAVFVKEWCDD